MLIIVTAFTANAQAPRKFYFRFGGDGYDVGYDIKQTLDNGYIITGSTSSYGQGNTDMYLVKLDSMGRTKFATTFGNYNNDIGKCVIQLADSGFVIAGYTNSTGFGGYDIFLVRTDKNGNSIWQKTIGGSDWDFAYSLQQTAEGGFIIAGTTYSYGHGNADGYLVKTDINGNVNWTKTFGGANDDEFKSVIQTTDGGYALTGYTKSYNDVDSGDVWVYKLNSLADSTWCHFYGAGQEDFGNEIIQHPSGEYYIAGGTKSFGVNVMNGYAIRLNNNGTFNYQMLDNTSSSFAFFNSIAVSNRSPNVIAFIAKETFVGFDLQFKILETDIYLNYVNGTDYGSVLADEMFKIISTKDKGYACIGYTNGYGAVGTDVYFLKTDSNLVGSTSIVSIKENLIDNYKISIFPNPTTNELNINSEAQVNTKEIKLFDVIGNEIFLDQKINIRSTYNLTLNTEDLTTGVYYLKVSGLIFKISIIH